MPSNEKFSLLRNILKTIGLSAEAIDDITERIADFLSEKEPKSTINHYPYHLRKDFVTKAEHNFYMVIRSIIPETVEVLAKVSLGDLFYVKSNDPSEFRTLTNKIDRKHVDFLLCDAKTMQPIAGIELDDKSHNRDDRQLRDEFVEKVYHAAKLPLVRFPAKFSYSTNELSMALKPYLNIVNPIAEIEPAEPIHEVTPKCPKCGNEMVLRTAKGGAKQGEQFWGCSKFPNCRGILKYEKV